jgi:urease subunit gamma/beta
MHLTPRERERLLLAAAADLARRRLARGAPLGATEAVALVCDEICELAWDGVALETVIERARAVIPAAALLPGVDGLVPVIEVEALFPWGSTLVHVDAPFAENHNQNPDGERAVASPGIAGSPGQAADAGAAAAGPGEVRAAAGEIALAPGAPRRTVLLRNTGQRDVWISSHFPLDQVNPAVEIRFTGDAKTRSVPHPVHEGRTGEGGPYADPDGGSADGVAVTGCRLDLPAGEALLLRPGEERTATAVTVAVDLARQA